MNFCCKIDDREDSKRIESAMKFFNENDVQTKPDHPQRRH